jgi:hypothetical protein
MQRAIQDHMDLASTIAWKHFSRVPGSGDLDEYKSIALEALVVSAAHWVSPYCESRGFDPWDPDDRSK